MEYPAINSHSIFAGCYVSDIGEDFIEIIDVKSGEESYSLSVSMPTVVSNGKITRNGLFDTDSYNIEGDLMDYQDIQIGDTVDIVYEYWRYGESPYEKMYCYGINVRKN